MAFVPGSNVFQKSGTYTVLSWLTTCLYFALFVMLFFSPHKFLTDVGMPTSESTAFLARRASVLMLGFAVLTFQGRKVRNPLARRVIALSVCVNMAGFAYTGLFEYWRGFANKGILNAVTVEVILSVAWLLLWLSCRSLIEEQPAGKSQTETVA
jgi:hypothetical protein